MIDFKIANLDSLKASEIFLIYAKPVLDHLPDGVNIKRARQMCLFCEMVWNATAMEQWPTTGNVKPVAMIRNSLKSHSDLEPSRQWMDTLLKRKSQLFPKAQWAFEISVREERSGDDFPWKVRAGVRILPELEHLLPARWRKNSKSMQIAESKHNE